MQIEGEHNNSTSYDWVSLNNYLLYCEVELIYILQYMAVISNKQHFQNLFT